MGTFQRTVRGLGLRSMYGVAIRFETTKGWRLQNLGEQNKVIVMGKESLPRNPSFEGENIFLKNQINAVARVLFLFADNQKITFNDITAALARAETTARFMCGFVALDDDATYKEQLKEYLVENQFITIDGQGYVSLTEMGNTRAETALPPQIEKVLN
jgi:fructose-specific component phosphotransferase system IIB-like protein